jgi:hypothetical protein
VQEQQLALDLVLLQAGTLTLQGLACHQLQVLLLEQLWVLVWVQGLALGVGQLVLLLTGAGLVCWHLPRCPCLGVSRILGSRTSAGHWGST